MTPIDQMQFTFDPVAVKVLNVVLATVVFGAALDVRLADFRRILVSPKGPLIGCLSQFVLLPATASLCVWLLKPAPSLGLGILLVAACPGGAVSNFYTLLARGNVALSLTVSAFSTLVAMVMTPFNFFFWGSLNPVTAGLLREIAVNPAEILLAAFFMLILPTLLAMSLRHWRAALADRLLRPVRTLGVLLLTGFIIAGIVANLQHATYVAVAFVVVLLVNAAGLAVGYGASRAAGLPHYDAKAVSLETGIQNAGFGLVLVFQFFGGLGGMALIAAWWGVWHLISGLVLALWWARMADVPTDTEAKKWTGITG
jgi:bile acid:Na+ symporter, BASS family